MKYPRLDLGQIEAIVNKLGGMEGVQKFLAEEIVVTASDKNLVFVDRTILPKYPDWMEKLEHPELESTGPAEFDVGKLDPWLHEEQKNDWVKGEVIHLYLKEHDMLKNCLGLRDLEEIQKKGITFFRKHFKGKYVFGWKSVVRSRDGDLRAPCLCCGYDGEVCLDWGWLGRVWYSDSPALRFVSA